ncbi:hypothetical protein CDEST_13983 [Colletotrichum destructivum]|uniref:Uncharacterized protein n=1 Tax=Colletotrichum destructivum TaxID=34406 RepID=A0AAX4J0H6_9PEZI|nr:hypothetical protein CDEST_13983 [Colletotrichum destructivum]
MSIARQVVGFECCEAARHHHRQHRHAMQLSPRSAGTSGVDSRKHVRNRKLTDTRCRPSVI